MVCLGLEPGMAGLKGQTNPQSYGGTPTFVILLLFAAHFDQVETKICRKQIICEFQECDV